MVNISKTFSSLLIRQVNGECCFLETSLAESTSISEVSALPMDLHFLEKLDDSTDGLSVVKDTALAMSHGCWIFHPSSSIICLLQPDHIMNKQLFCGLGSRPCVDRSLPLKNVTKNS
jgi:hypothetical protein